MRTTLIAVFVTVLCAGCQRGSLNDVRDNAQEIMEGARTRADRLRDLTAEELQAMWAVEYRSVEVARGDLARADDVLNELGRDRWECYHVGESGEGRVFYFKRNSSNLTAHLTNLLRLGALAF